MDDSKPTEIVLTKKQKIIKELKSLTVIVIVVFAFRSTFFEPFKIPTGSMIPTLMIGDFILVKKFTYGFKLPFSDMFTDPIYITKPTQPKHGDIVVFKFPKDESFNYIKRLIGVPGDTVEIRNKIVYINDKPVEMTEIPGKPFMDDMDDQYKNSNLKFYKLKNGEHEHVVQLDEDRFQTGEMEKRVIPEGKYFVMGDNRDGSYDSRFWGYVPFENIKGTAIFVWFSLSLPFGENTFKFRPWRIGTVLK